MKIIKNLKYKMKDFFEKNPILLGGPQSICQIDETLLSGKRKYNVGNQVSKQTWVFGICDPSTTPGLGFMKVVSDRRAQTLIHIIKEIIGPGTIIWSDGLLIVISGKITCMRL